MFIDTAHLDYWQLTCNHVAVLVGMDIDTVLLNDPYFDTAPQKATVTCFQSAWAANEQLTALIRPNG